MFSYLRSTTQRVIYNNKFKKDTTIQRQKVDFSTLIAPTSLFNSVVDDKFSDILTLTKKNSFTNSTPINEVTLNLFQKGHEFEEEATNFIKKKFKDEYVVTGNNSRSFEDVDLTTESIKKGIPIIFHPVFHDYENKFYGVGDFIIRSDYLPKLITGFDYENKKFGCKFSSSWHYVVVDVKWQKLHLCCEGKYLTNSPKIRFYKVQLLTYNNMLARIQGFNPNYAFLLGRNYKYEKNGEWFKGTGAFEKLGCVDFSKRDRKIKKIQKQAVKWIREMRKVLSNINYENLTWDIVMKYGLFPNMKVQNKYDTIQTKKYEFSLENGEHTLIYQVSSDRRNLAIKSGFKSFRDEGCTHAAYGFKSNCSYARIIDSMIIANTKRDITTIINKATKEPNLETVENVITQSTQSIQSQSTQSTFVVYIDVESSMGIFSKDSVDVEYHNDCFVFMTTYGHFNLQSGMFECKTITSNGLGEDNERAFFIDLVKSLNDDFGSVEKCTFVHWGHHDKTMWKGMQHRHKIYINPKMWLDGNRVMYNHAIGIKGCFGYGLKAVAKALKIHFPDAILQSFANDENGVLAAKKAQEVADKANIGYGFKNHPVIKSIETYNVKDVVVMYEVMKLLRSF